MKLELIFLLVMEFFLAVLFVRSVKKVIRAAKEKEKKIIELEYIPFKKDDV